MNRYKLLIFQLSITYFISVAVVIFARSESLEFSFVEYGGVIPVALISPAILGISVAVLMRILVSFGLNRLLLKHPVGCIIVDSLLTIVISLVNNAPLSF